MRKTENFELNLMDGDDFVNKDTLNENAEKVDKVLKQHENPEYDASEQEEVEELTSGESLKTAFRKLARAVKELIAHMKDTTVHFTEEERAKLKNVAEEANKTVVDAELSSTSTNPVQNKVVQKALDDKFGATVSCTANTVLAAPNGANGSASFRKIIAADLPVVSNLTTANAGFVLDARMGKSLQDGKVDKVAGKGLSTNDYTTTEKQKLAGIATGANKTIIINNLTTSTAGSALDAVQGNTLYNYIRALQSDVVYLKYLAKTNVSDFIEAKYIKKYSSDELGNIHYAYIPYDIKSKLTTSNKIIVSFSDGAIGVFNLESNFASTNLLGRTITWIKGNVPYVAKTTIQAGTNTLALANGSGGYAIWDDDIYKSTGKLQYTIVLEIASSSKDISTFYKII